MKTTVLFSLALTCITVLCGPATAQIYRTTDANGNVIFTDTPPPGGSSEEVQLQHTNTAPPPPPRPAKPVQEKPAEEVIPEQIVMIKSPANEETIPMGGGNFSVVAEVEPGLEKGQSLRLSLDGAQAGRLMQSGFWDLTSVSRGAHDLTVAVVDSTGEVVTASKPVRVYVMRPGLNRP